MKIQGKFEVIDKQEKSGKTKDGRDWNMTEYVLKNVEECYDGSELETFIPATCGKTVDELEVGGVYDATLFISSRASKDENNKDRYFVSFRVTKADKLGASGKQEQPAETKPEVSESVSDDIPF